MQTKGGHCSGRMGFIVGCQQRFGKFWNCVKLIEHFKGLEEMWESYGKFRGESGEREGWGWFRGGKYGIIEGEGDKRDQWSATGCCSVHFSDWACMWSLQPVFHPLNPISKCISCGCTLCSVHVRTLANHIVSRTRDLSASGRSGPSRTPRSMGQQQEETRGWEPATR